LSRVISVTELRDKGLPSVQLVDVRSISEFAAGHIGSAVNIPLDQLEGRIADLRPGVPIVLVCQAGTRARMAAGLLEPCGRELAVLEGGTNAWTSAGLPLVRSLKTRWSLERQVRLGAGLLVLTGVLLSLRAHGYWVFLAAFAGLGLTFAGLTDFCPMGILLARMPWNKRSHCAIGVSQTEPCAGGK